MLKAAGLGSIKQQSLIRRKLMFEVQCTFLLYREYNGDEVLLFSIKPLGASLLSVTTGKAQIPTSSPGVGVGPNPPREFPHAASRCQ